MSDTPRNDETPEFRDPTAPIETDQTQEVPPIPPAPAAPLGPPASQPTPPGPPPTVAPGGQPAYGPPPGGQPAYGPPPGSAAQNPYAAPAPGAGTPPPPPNPYGAPAYGSPAPGATAYGAPGYGAPTYATPRSLSGNTIALLVVSGLTTLGCGFGIVALVFGIIAATKKDDPSASAKYTKWGWVAFGVGLALAVIAVGLIIAFAVTSGPPTYDSSY